MKIKEYIGALGYSLTYTDDITINMGDNDVRFICDDIDNTIQVIIKDFEGHLHRIAFLTEEDSPTPDRYSTWCDQDYYNNIPYNRTIHTIV